MVWSSCQQKQGPYIVCRLDGSIYAHVLKYSCSEVSCGLQHWHNVGKPNTFLSLIWNGFGLAPLSIKAFGHFVERSEGGFCESSRRSPAWGVEGGLARAPRCAPALAPGGTAWNGVFEREEGCAGAAAEACLWHPCNGGLQRLWHASRVLKA